MSIEVTDDLVRYVAGLARLELTDEEADEIRTHFEKVLRYVDDLDELDLEGVDPTLFSLDASNVDREDVPRPCLPVEEGLANAPARSGTSFVVPRIVGGDAGGGA